MRILLAEDDKRLSKMIAFLLKKENPHAQNGTREYTRRMEQYRLSFDFAGR